MGKVNVYEDGKVIARVQYNDNLDYWDGKNWTCGSIGRTDLPGGNFATLEKSIREQIYTMPDETRLLSGHGSETTVGHEKQHNPFVSE